MAEYIYDRLFIPELNNYADTHQDSYHLYDDIIQQFGTASINCKDDKISIILPEKLSQADESKLDSIVENANNNAYSNILEELKEDKVAEIRNENQQILFEKGAEFPPGSGIRYSMRDTDMAIWNGMLLAANSFTYPVTVRDVDNIPHQLNSFTEVQQFWGTGLAYAQSVFDSTVAKITEVINLTTITEVLNWTDDRLD